MNKELCIKVGKWNNSILWCTVKKHQISILVLAKYMLEQTKWCPFVIASTSSSILLPNKLVQLNDYDSFAVQFQRSSTQIHRQCCTQATSDKKTRTTKFLIWYLRYSGMLISLDCYLPTFRYNLLAASSSVKQTKKNIYQSTLSNISLRQRYTNFG